jgi:predicted dehydrogenase
MEAGEIGDPEMLVITSRDPGAPPVEYIKHSGGIFKDMLIHDFDIFRWMLDDEADTLHATGSCLSDPAIAEAGDIDSTAVTIRTKRGRLCQINTARRAAYGYDQRFEAARQPWHAASRQCAPDRSHGVFEDGCIERCAGSVFPRALSRGVRRWKSPISSMPSRKASRSARRSRTD